MSFCPQCGTQIPEQGRFCPSCGNPAPGFAQPQQQSPPPVQTAPPTPQPIVPRVPQQPVLHVQQAPQPIPTKIAHPVVKPPLPRPVQPVPRAVIPPSPIQGHHVAVKPLQTERTFDKVAKDKKYKGRSPLARILLMLSSLTGIYFWTLPFYQITTKTAYAQFSGLWITQAGLRLLNMDDHEGGKHVIDTISKLPVGFQNPEAAFKLAGVLAVILPVAIFGLMFLLYFISFLRGRRYTSGFTFSIAYTVMAGVILFVAGMEMGEKLVIFQHVGPAYWGTVICLFCAKISSKI